MFLLSHSSNKQVQAENSLACLTPFSEPICCVMLSSTVEQSQTCSALTPRGHTLPQMTGLAFLKVRLVFGLKSSNTGILPRYRFSNRSLQLHVWQHWQPVGTTMFRAVSQVLPLVRLWQGPQRMTSQQAPLSGQPQGSFQTTSCAAAKSITAFGPFNSTHGNNRRSFGASVLLFLGLTQSNSNCEASCSRKS